MLETATLELTEAAATTGTLRQRAQTVLDVVVRHVPCDAAWLAGVDPVRGGYASLASTHLDRSTVAYLSGPRMARDIELTRTDPSRPPLSPSDLPCSASELSTWAECLVPGDFHEALAVALVDRQDRHVGFLALLSSSRRPPAAATRRALQQLVPWVARGVDPLRHVAAAADLLDGATAGAVLYRRGHHGELPGLDGDDLLAPGSPLTAVARSSLEAGRPFSTFLWPRGSRHAPDGHARATVLAGRQDQASPVLGAVVLSAADDCRGLTPRELEVLGLLVEGCSNAEIARTLVLALRTVAAHLEHVLTKLEAPTRTLAAVRADREGLYVPMTCGGPLAR
ncbi:response regulator transcription factor [Streptomyces sp. NP160]|uniref:helix-turn-helix transcriptional regulator n=1 Tax=Streptomyces sp. NP160 TaxID=2586637 RepID=UPI00111A7C38|nr:LuxR C-terminal-related transcriptional regulator [Streptomyces sp. NP160]TNM67072.1 response regulator transcription factor [Streptomyces sp. NP160]